MHRVVKRCPTCHFVGPIPVLDVRYYAPSNGVIRSHRCPSCKRIISTREIVVNPDRQVYSLRTGKGRKRHP